MNEHVAYACRTRTQVQEFVDRGSTPTGNIEFTHEFEFYVFTGNYSHELELPAQT